MRGWGGQQWGGFFPFISEVSSSNVVYLLHSSPFSVHFWNSYRIAFCIYWSTQPVLLPSNRCYTRGWIHQIFLGCDFFAAPVSSVSELGLFFLDLHTGSGGMEFQITLCSAASRFLSATNLLTRLQLFSGRETISVFRQWAFFLSFTLDPGVAGHGVGRIPECSCPAGFTS